MHRRYSRQTDGQTNRHTDRHMDIHAYIDTDIIIFDFYVRGSLLQSLPSISRFTALGGKLAGAPALMVSL